MAANANTYQEVDAVGNREDLSDFIYNIDPDETPFMTNIGTPRKVKATKHEWQVDALAAASDTNAKVQGDEYTVEAVTPTTRVGNFTQISHKNFSISGTQEAVESAGRNSEIAYQRVKKGKEMKRDIEKQMLSNKASVAPAGATAGQSAGFESWLETNVSRGATGANGGFNTGTGVVDAPTAGTNRTVTEALLKTVLQSCFENGGKPTTAYMNAALKGAFSTFTGIADIRKDAPGKAQATIIGAADVYVSDFGMITMVPHAYGTRANSVLLVDHNYVAKGVLRPMFEQELAVTGDAEKRAMNEEYTLIVDNEAAHGIIADVTAT